jgi:methylaspartate ammonia-lyase
MKIDKVLLTAGLGGYYWQDEAAEKAGAEKDGFVFLGEPITPGFPAIRTPSQALCLSLICGHGRIAEGDCVTVQYGARSGRDPVFWTAHYLPFFRDRVSPLLEGMEVKAFRPAARLFDAVEINGKPLPAAIRYGVTQALLHAVALRRECTMAEVVAEEYGTKIAAEPVDLYCQIDEQWHNNTDKCILRRVPVFPHLPISSSAAFEKLQEYLLWVRQRIPALAGEEFKPILHFDLYGALGLKYSNSIPKMVDWLQGAEDILSPYRLIIEEPVDMGSRTEQIEFMAELKAHKDARGLRVVICADEWCNSLDDVKAFVEGNAADMVQLKTPDIGGVHHVIEAALFLKANGIRVYLGGSSSETLVSRRVIAHVALATQPHQLLAAPGMGVDEGYTASYNEMARSLAIISSHSKSVFSQVG